MTEARVSDGDLYIIFADVDDNVLTSCRLDNGAEFDFRNDELVQIVLPNFEAQLNRGSLLGLSIDLVDVQFQNEIMILSIKIMNDTINISLDCSSIIHKL